MIKWRHQYDAKADAAADAASALACDPSDDMTMQSFRDDADINLMLRRYGVTGQMPVAASEPFYGDFSEVGDYQSALEAVMEAQANFEALPSAIRSRFGNNPGLLLEFVSRKENLEEAIRLGLVEAPEVPVGDPVAPESGNDS